MYSLLLMGNTLLKYERKNIDIRRALMARVQIYGNK